MPKKNIAYVIAVIGLSVIAASAATYYLTRKPGIIYRYDTAQIKNLTEEVGETGSVKAAQDVDLSFERSGKISRVYAHAGDKVKAGQILLTLDNADLAAQVAQAQAALNKALAGNTPEYIAQLQATLDKANNDLSQVQGSVPGAESSKLVQNAYDDMLANLQSVQINLSSALTAADNILGIDNTMANTSFKTYLSLLDPNELLVAKAQYDAAKSAKNTFDDIFNSLNQNSNHADIDDAAQKGSSALLSAKDLLFDLTSVLNNTAPMGTLSQASLDGMKANIEATRATIAGSYASLTNAIHAIATARNSYESLQDVADKAQAALNDAKNPPRDVDVAGLRASVALAAATYNKTIMRSPINGILSRQDGDAGAIVSPNVPIASVISEQAYQIETFVSESDIAKVKIGDRAEITLDNLGDSVVFDEKVIKIDPAAEQMNDGTNAYKITLEFSKNDDRIKAGLTANVSIITATEENVMAVPQRDVVQKNGGYFVMAAGGGDNPEEKKVEVGIRGADGEIEIISGLNEGEKIISFGNNQ